MSKGHENLIPAQKGEVRNPHGYTTGKKNRSTIAKQILAMRGVLPTDVQEKLRAMFPGISNEMSIEEIATIQQLNKAIETQDTNAYKAVMDSAYGAPVQQTDVDVTTNGQSLEPTKIVFTKGVKDGQ